VTYSDNGSTFKNASFFAGFRRKSAVARVLMAVLPVALISTSAMGANLTWDSGGTHPTAPADGSGAWDTTTAFWSNAATDAVWDNVSTAVFGANNGAAGTVTIDDLSGTVTAAGLTFNAATSGNYLIAASGLDTLTLSGTTPIISVAPGVNPTISAPIAGSFGSYAPQGGTALGLIIKGQGTLTLSGVNTFAGSTIIENGNTTATAGTTVNLTAGSLGNTVSNIYVGFAPTGSVTDSSSLTMTGTSSLTAAQLVVDYNFGQGTISTTTGATLNVNGTNTINANTITVTAARNSGNAKGGLGTLKLGSGATLTLNDAVNDGGNVTLLDIANYSYETGGTTGTGIAGVADFSAGTVTGNITTVNIGTGKAGSGNATGGVANGSLLFANGTLNIGTLNISRKGSNGSNGTLTLSAGGTGTLNAGTITFGAVGNGTSANGVNGTININGANLVLTGDITSALTNGIINLSGGTLNMQGHNIGVGSAITLNAAAGTLENVATINGAGGLTTTGTGAQVLNLLGTNSYTGNTTIGAGGTVIVGTATAMGTGAGGLIVNGGTLDLNGFSQSVVGLSGTGGVITNNGVSAPVTLTANGTNGTGNFAGVIQNGTSSVALSLTGSGTLRLTSASNQTYTGATNINSGSTLTIANINSTTAVTDNGTLAANGTVGSIALDSGASLTAGPVVSSNTTGSLNGTTLTVGPGGASLNFLLTSAVAFDHLALSSTATLNGPLAVNATIGASLASGTYNILSASALTINGNTITPTITVGGGGLTRVSASLQETLTQIQLVVNGSPANLTWTGAADTTSWDVVTHANWTSTAPIDPTHFYNQDSVTFDNSSSNLTVNLVGTIQPGAVNFNNNNTHNYILTGSGISDSGTGTNLTMNGNGTVTLQNLNTYAGNTTVNSGTLVIDTTGAIAGNTLASAASTAVTVNSGGSITTTTLNVSGALNVNGSVAGTTLTLSSPAVATVSATGNLSTATVAVNGGSLTIQSSGTLASGIVNVANGASLNVNAGAIISVPPSLTNNGNVVIGSDQSIFSLNGTDVTATLTQTGNISIAHTGTYAGIIKDGTSSGGLTLTGNTLTLTGANLYSGPTTVTAGTLIIDAGANTGSINPASPVSVTGTIAIARTGTQTFSNTITGAGGVRQLGGGTLTLTGNNSGFSGTVQAYNGTIVQNDANSFGTGGLVLGTPEAAGVGTTTPTGNINLNATVTATTVSSISSTSGNVTASPTPNVLTIPAGVTLTNSGATTVGSSNSTSNVFNTLSATGGGSIVLNGAVTVSQAGSIATLDLSGLNSAAITTTTVNIGNGGAAGGNLILANTSAGLTAPSNSITAGTLNMATTSTNNPSVSSTLTLGSGTNNIFATAINLGSGRGSASIGFAAGAPSTASVNIADQSGTGAAAIIMCNASTNGNQGGTGSFLNLAGFNANVLASSLIMAENTGNIQGGAIAGVTFDTGNFTVNGAVTMAADTGGSSITGVTANLTIGGATPNTTATGVFNAGSIILGSFTNTNGAVTGSAIATATLTINGGTVNVTSGITNNSTQGTTVSTLNLNSGTLNMNATGIGGAGAVNSGTGPITVVLPAGGQTATLANLGAGGINGVGLDMNNLGVLKIDGASTSYTGSTTINAGGTISVLATGTLPATTDVVDNGTLILANPTQAINSLNSTTAATLTLNSTVLTVTNGGSFIGAIQSGATPGGLIVPAATTLTTDSVKLGSLEVDGNHVIRSNAIPSVSKINSLIIAGSYGGSASAISTWTGSLDLTNSKLIIEDSTGSRAADIAKIKDEALASNTTGLVGIFSSTANAANLAAGKVVKVVAVSDNAVRIATFPAGSTNFGGTNNVDASSILVAAVFKGDANMDGVVDIQDLTDVANHWQQSVTDWSQGDFDGSNFVDIQDLTAVANNWQAGVGAGGGSSFSDALAQIGGFKPAATPEPASLALLGLGGLLLTNRRRRA